MASRTDEEWASAIERKVAQVLADGSGTDYAPAITVPDKLFAQTIDHTLLKPDATPAQIDGLCEEARKYGFKVFISHIFLLLVVFFASFSHAYGGCRC
jgi:deoxyribose-phosphate aldolase